MLRSGRMGLEKENLRVGQDGHISQISHPELLGSALTHPFITTDYSEALLEFITPPFQGPPEALDFLRDLHRFVYEKLDNELLWAGSMPCVVAGDASIPIAYYGNSNVGTMKTVYRRGLGYRYGRLMQVIAGGHFNYSFAKDFWPVFQGHEKDDGPLRNFVDSAYFCLIRNLQRVGWLVPYLFGSSPAICKSFMGGQPTQLQEFNANTYYEPFATSLRVSDIGYQNTRESEAGIKVSYDNLDRYVKSLAYAIETGHPEYEKIGVLTDGEYRQLNGNILQIENEYYSSVRPKPLLIGNEKPTLALKKRGVEYVELRSLDVNALEPLGLSEDQLRFLEALMIFCLFQESPAIGEQEHEEVNWNLQTVAARGREPGLKLRRLGQELGLLEWASEICGELTGICELLDQGAGSQAYSRSLERQTEAVRDPDRTPSARMLAGMRASSQGFFHFVKSLSQAHHHYFSKYPLDQGRRLFFQNAVQQSIEKQREIEASDDCAFDEYLERYFAQT
ncbi:MAG: glutamate--cysteine ligase [Gammaproteobacteria bacterium]